MSTFITTGETYRLPNGNCLEFVHDDFCENPFLDCDHDYVKFYNCHKGYNLSEKAYNFRSMDSCLDRMIRDLIPWKFKAQWIDDCLEYGYDKSEVAKVLETIGRFAYIMPVYAYEHDGITLPTGRFADMWDSGQIGWIAIRKADFTHEYLSKKDRRLNAKARATKAESMLQGWIKTIDQYLTGECYGFKVTDKHGEVVNSCFGFLGSDLETNGILDHVGLTIEEFKRLDTWTEDDE